MKRLGINFVITLILGVLIGCVFTTQKQDVLFQTSTINALLESMYEGELTCLELKQQGDFGLGTFNSLDGEMVLINDTVYQVKSDGFVYLVDDTVKTPFASVTFFKSDKFIELVSSSNFEEFKSFLDEKIGSKNIFYAIRIKGKFDKIKVRSVPKQEKPYPPLVEVAKNQPEFSYKNIEGTILGFRCPEYVKGINVPGYHFHFISKNRKVGGHLLDCQLNNVKIQLDETYDFFMQLPDNISFHQLNLNEDKQKELDVVEN